MKRETKGTGKNTGVYFTLEDLAIFARLKQRYTGAPNSAIMRLALRALLREEKIEVAS